MYVDEGAQCPSVQLFRRFLQTQTTVPLLFGISSETEDKIGQELPAEGLLPENSRLSKVMFVEYGPTMVHESEASLDLGFSRAPYPHRCPLPRQI
jgi:hypothetical protein